MNIMVVGGAGFIGSHVVKFALEKGNTVDVVDLKRNKDLDVGNSIIWDIRCEDMLSFDFSHYDIVIMEAALTSQLERQTNLFDTNVKGLFNVLEACRKSKVSKFVYASSSAIYGNLNTFYGLSKTIGERLVNGYKSYFDVIVLRYFNTYGFGESSKRDYQSIISLFMQQIRDKGCVSIYGDGTQKRDFIHVKDVARITYELALETTSGTIDVGTGHATSWNKILDIIQQNGYGFERKYVVNPLPNYQKYTRADTSTLAMLGLEAQISLPVGIRKVINNED